MDQTGLRCVWSRRLMWGSDCPYQLQNGNNFVDSVALIRDQLDFLSPSDRSAILRDTAERIFFILSFPRASLRYTLGLCRAAPLGNAVKHFFLAKSNNYGGRARTLRFITTGRYRTALAVPLRNPSRRCHSGLSYISISNPWRRSR